MSASFPHYGSLIHITATSSMNISSGSPVPEGCVMSDFFPVVPWDNEDNLVPKEVDNIINLLFNGVFLPLLFIVSFCTNVVSMVVFFKLGLKERINACLFTLSLVDLLSITISFSFSSDVLYMFLAGRGGELGLSNQFFIRNNLTGLIGMVLSSQLVYCVIALERCLCVTRPLLVKSFMSTRTTVAVLWTMVVIVTGGCVFTIGVRYSVICVFDPADASVSYVNYPTDFYFRHKLIMDVLYSAVFGLFLPGLSLVSVTVCTVVTAIKLKKLALWRASVSSSTASVTSRDVAVARVIVATSVLFIVCIVPAIVMRTAHVIVPGLRLGGPYDNLAWLKVRPCHLKWIHTAAVHILVITSACLVSDRG
ncbi:uncharacterized protein LOC143300812 [Babylonia areolata]|uniref:uncharacterized protein LOC143300812 n=1 Tax=Babylonia areolata TaxID=304850 RepID=UPI003FCF0012